MTLTQDTLRSILNYDPATGAFTWIAGRRSGQVADGDHLGYVRINIKGHRHFAHNLAWLWMTGAFPRHLVDRISGSRADNRFENLREATRSQNSMNTKTRADNQVGLKGVRKRKDRASFGAVIKIDGKQKTLGYFKTPELAHAAYCRAAETHFGKYARAS